MDLMLFFPFLSTLYLILCFMLSFDHMYYKCLFSFSYMFASLLLFLLFELFLVLRNAVLNKVYK